MSETILDLNAGSSSLKFSLFPGREQPSREDVICYGECEGIGHRAHIIARDGQGMPLVDRYLAERASHEDALGALVPWLEDLSRGDRLIAVGHNQLAEGKFVGQIDAHLMGRGETCRRAGWRYVVSDHSGETEDTFMADLAVAMGGGQVKAGSACRGEHMAKYNCLLELALELGATAVMTSDL